MKLTDASIKALKSKKVRYEVWETNGNGFGLRVSPHGRKSFIFFYRFNGLNRRMTLGTYPEIKLVEGHALHAQARKSLSDGIDPGEKIIETKKADREAYTVADLVNEFLKKWSMPRKRTWAEDKRCLEREVTPVLGNRKAKDVRRRDLILILDRIVDRGSGAMANRTLNILTKLFNFAVSRDILDTSPCVQISMPAPKVQRDRFLSEDEIGKFWNGLPGSGISKPCQLAMKLVLTSAQRRGEIAEARWSEFDMDGKLWTIPAERAKNNLKHTVPLSDLALSLLADVKAIASDSVYLFPSPRTQTHIDPRAVTRALRKAQDHFGLEQFKVHDLRRSAATGMAKMGVSRFDIGQILNHSEKSVTKIYDRFQYLPQKKDALERWGRRLEQIISGEPGKGKLIELKRK